MSTQDLYNYVAKIEKISPRDGDIIALKLNISETQMSETLVQSIGELAGLLEDYGIQNPLLVLGKDSSIESIDDKTLAHLGLARIPKTTETDSIVDDLYQ